MNVIGLAASSLNSREFARAGMTNWRVGVVTEKVVGIGPATSSTVFFREAFEFLSSLRALRLGEKFIF